MFILNNHGSLAPLVHNSHVVAYKKRRIAEWNSWLHKESQNKGCYDRLMTQLMGDYRWEKDVAQITNEEDLRFFYDND